MKRKKRRIFFTSFFSTLCILGLLIGIATVDENSRRIGLGDDRTFLSRTVGKTWQESCNAVKIWYNQIVSSFHENAVEESG